MFVTNTVRNEGIDRKKRYRIGTFDNFSHSLALIHTNIDLVDTNRRLMGVYCIRWWCSCFYTAVGFGLSTFLRANSKTNSYVYYRNY